MADSKEDYIIHGSPLEYVPEYTSVGKLIFDRLRTDPAFIGQIEAHTGIEYTNAEILDRSIRLALWLRDMDIGPGDVVSYITCNHKDVIIVLYATFFVGAIASPWDAAETSHEIGYSMARTSPKLVVCVEEIANAVKTAAEEIHAAPIFLVHGKSPGFFSFDDALESNSKTEIDRFQCTEVEENDTALLMCTSGTTALPKITSQSHKSVLIGIQCLARGMHRLFPPGSVFLACVPVSWMSGMYDILKGLLRRHQRVVANLHNIDQKSFWSWIEKYRVNYTTMIPAVLSHLLNCDEISNYDKSSLRLVNLGGSALHEYHRKMFQQFASTSCKLRQGYGITEMGGLISIQTDIIEGSSGQLIQGMSGKIVDPRTGKTISPRETGELCLKHPIMFEGYYNDPESTNLAIDSDGWFHTGDLARFDQNGELFVIDRWKDVLDINGVQVSLSELEAILLQHPAVRHAGLVVERDPFDVQHLVAFVVKNPEANVTETELCDFVKLRVDNENKQLQGGVRFIDQMPLTTSGKLKRSKLREM